MRGEEEEEEGKRGTGVLSVRTRGAPPLSLRVGVMLRLAAGPTLPPARAAGLPPGPPPPLPPLPPGEALERLELRGPKGRRTPLPPEEEEGDWGVRRAGVLESSGVPGIGVELGGGGLSTLTRGQSRRKKRGGGGS